LSRASDLAGGSSGSTDNVYWRDLQTGTTFAVSTNGGALAPSMSTDGRYVAYSSGLPTRLFILDSQALTTIYTNSSSNVSYYRISPDGRSLVFQTGGQLRSYDSVSNSEVVIGTIGTSC
jgi:Tol biopolymer transport system component